MMRSNVPQPIPAAGLLGGAGVEVAFAARFPSLVERDLFIAEVCLSLDSVADGSQFFRECLETETGEARLSSAIILAHLSLLQGKFDDYHQLLSVEVAPTVFRQARSSLSRRGGKLY